MIKTEKNFSKKAAVLRFNLNLIIINFLFFLFTSRKKRLYISIAGVVRLTNGRTSAIIKKKDKRCL